MENQITISHAGSEDLSSLLNIHNLAFGNEKESELTYNLINDDTSTPVVSLVARTENQIVGHILFTRIYFANETESPLMHLLAPLAIHPEFQNLGIGKSLILNGIEELRTLESERVFVLGHPGYYPKAGFRNDAESYGYMAPYPIPPEHKDAWMIMELKSKEIVSRNSVQMRCADALNREEYWRE